MFFREPIVSFPGNGRKPRTRIMHGSRISWRRVASTGVSCARGNGSVAITLGRPESVASDRFRPRAGVAEDAVESLLVGEDRIEPRRSSDEEPGPWPALAGRNWPFFVWLGICLPAFWVLPAIDDWGATAPLPLSFEWNHLAPGLWWRPIEKLDRLLLGRYSFLYPQYLHVLSVVGHGLSGWLVYRLARRLGASASTSRLLAALFLIHPGGCSVVWSVDGGIRTWSTACGLASIDVYLTKNRQRAMLGWLFLAAAAALWYEPGLRWFLAAPLFRELMLALRFPLATPIRSVCLRLTAGMAAGLLAFTSYFIIRWLLIGELTVAGSGRYALTFEPLVWIRNAAMLGGVSFSTVDTIALLGPSPNYAMAALSLLLGLPLLVVAAHHCLRTWSIRALLFGFISLIAVLAPHLPQAHVSEFYAHPIVAIVAIMLVGHSGKAPTLRATRDAGITMALFVAAALAVDAHKAVALVRTGRAEDQVGKAIVQLIPEPPQHLCVVSGGADERKGYSVFVAPSGPDSRWGFSARGRWGWSNDVRFFWVRQIDSCPIDSDAVITLSAEGDVEIVKPL